MKDHKPNEEIVEVYASKMGLKLDDARERLNAKYQEEVDEVDAKEVALKAIKAIRALAPRVHGVELRESGLNFAIKEAKLEAAKANKRCDDLKNQIELLIKAQRQTVDTVDTVDTVNVIFKETEERVGAFEKKQIEYKKTSLYGRLCHKITSTLQKLKS